MKYLLLSFLFFSCSHFEPKQLATTPSALNKAPSSLPWTMGNVTFTCQGSHCLKWQGWLEEFVKKSKSLKIPRSFYRYAPKDISGPKNISQFISLQKNLHIHYQDFHCLEEQLSCTFDGEQGKVFFNYKSLGLAKEEWLGVLMHEVFHLNYPAVLHIACNACPDKKNREFGDCDKNSFSSYGLERLWHQTHAKSFFADKKSYRKNKIILSNLNKRFCN